MTRYREKDIAGIAEALLKVGTNNQVCREADTRKVASVFTVGHHSLKQINLINPTEPYLKAATRKLQCQRRAPGPGADNRDFLWRVVAY